MKNPIKITAFLVLFALLGLLVPVGSFNAVEAAQIVSENYSRTTVVHVQTSSIHVVQVVPASVLVPLPEPKAPLLAANCSTAKVDNVGLQGSVVDLHEPAGCLNLQISVPVKAPSVSVRPLTPTKVSIVVLQNAVLSNFTVAPFAPVPPSTTLPVVEALVLMFAVGIVHAQKKFKITQFSFDRAFRAPVVSPLRC